MRRNTRHMSVSQRAADLLRRFGARADFVARCREDAARTEALARHYADVGQELDRQRYVRLQTEPQPQGPCCVLCGQRSGVVLFYCGVPKHVACHMAQRKEA